MKKFFYGTVLCYLLMGAFSLDVFAAGAVALDPGHGGSNLGAYYLVENNSDVLEKDLNLRLAEMIQEELQQQGCTEVFLTRQEDVGISIRERAAYARQLNAEFLVSLHFNASEKHNLFGTEIWVPAEKVKHQDEAVRLAECFEKRLVFLGLDSRGIKVRTDDASDEDYYGIIREGVKCGIPTILVEHCFLDHENDAPFWQGEEALRKLAQADAAAIMEYLNEDNSELDFSDSMFYLGNSRQEDRTPPQRAALKAQYFDGNEAVFTLWAEDQESKIAYYDYSLDGGITWSKLYGWGQEETREVILREDEVTGKVLFRIYNGFDLYTQLEVVPKVERIAVSEYNDTEEDLVREQAAWDGDDVGEIWVLTIGVLILLGWCLLIQYSHARRRVKYQKLFGLDQAGAEMKCKGREKATPMIAISAGRVDGSICRNLWKYFIYYAVKAAGYDLEVSDIESFFQQTRIMMNGRNSIAVNGILLTLNLQNVFQAYQKDKGQGRFCEKYRKLYKDITFRLPCRQYEKESFDELEVQVMERRAKCSGEQEFDYYAKLYDFIVGWLGDDNVYSHIFAGAIVYGECISLGGIPFLINIKRIFETYKEDKDTAKRIMILCESFAEAQADLLRQELYMMK